MLTGLYLQVESGILEQQQPPIISDIQILVFLKLFSLHSDITVRDHHLTTSSLSAESFPETEFLSRQTKRNKNPLRGTLSGGGGGGGGGEKRAGLEINELSLVRWNSLLRLLLPILSIPACRAALGLLTVMKHSITPPPPSSPLLLLQCFLFILLVLPPTASLCSLSFLLWFTSFPSALLSLLQH